jgi:hypothetical protein
MRTHYQLKSIPRYGLEHGTTVPTCKAKRKRLHHHNMVMSFSSEHDKVRKGITIHTSRIKGGKSCMPLYDDNGLQAKHRQKKASVCNKNNGLEKERCVLGIQKFSRIRSNLFAVKKDPSQYRPRRGYQSSCPIDPRTSNSSTSIRTKNTMLDICFSLRI